MIAALPQPRVPDPYDAPPLRWGILAPGGIAGRMVEALHAYTRQQVVAVGSRSTDRAQAFAAKYGIPNAYGSYEHLVADDKVDIIYVASPHSEHVAHAKLALKAGKPTLVEKAFTRNQAEAKSVVATARAAKVPVMEAIMTRQTPTLDIVKQLVDNGDLGLIDTILADHGQNLTKVPRLVKAELAGGALLDLGVYCVHFAVFLGGLPTRVVATGALTNTGVDAHMAMSFDGFARLPNALAAMHTTMLSGTPTRAAVCGSEARAELVGPGPFTPGCVMLRIIKRDGDVIERPAPGITGSMALCYEAAHFARVVSDGLSDSPIMPADESIAIMGLLDEMRSQVGVIYPGE
ncbi:MAG: Gfo/Idh/MocA family oxidoreductase [Propionibacteriaceae bacterium]|nr:Gfo/Idh/MocA family oxidoreductase [Propionibacteriaceae bacterium]